MKYQCMLFIFLFFVGCGTVQTIPYSYKTVSDVLKEKFVENGDAFATIKPQVTESKGEMEILFSVDVDFYFSITPMITIKEKSSKETYITIKVTEYFKSWSYQSRNKNMEKEFIATLEKRLKTGNWEKMPWRKKENINQSIFSAIFGDIGE